MVFGNKNKVEFDAQISPTERTADLHQNPQKYSFVHNFKVHYKRGALQALASKLDVSITSSSPQLPSMQEVTEEFHRRMASSLPLSNTRVRYGNASYHITNVEYKESIAMFLPQSYQQTSTQVAGTGQTLQQQAVGNIFCRNCGNSLPLSSRFCNKCGTPVA